jgi:hypothetical protein
MGLLHANFGTHKFGVSDCLHSADGTDFYFLSATAYTAYTVGLPTCVSRHYQLPDFLLHVHIQRKNHQVLRDLDEAHTIF